MGLFDVVRCDTMCHRNTTEEYVFHYQQAAEHEVAEEEEDAPDEERAAPVADD